MNLFLNAPFNPLGYGVVGKNIMSALINAGADLTLFPIGNIEAEQSEISLLNQHTYYGSKIPSDFSTPTLKIWHQHSLFDHIGKGKYYAMPIFELNKFSKLEESSLSCPDVILVCSQWAKDVITTILNKPTCVVPLGYNPDIFKPSNKENSGSYKFFNIGKIEKRKGHDILIECFNRAFDEDDDVELHMLWANPFLSYEQTLNWHKLYYNSKLGNKVKIHNRMDGHMQVAKFIQSMDCGVFPSRAEGWNLELLESIVSNKPVITTNYSAHTEFCNKENSYLVDITQLETAYDGIWFNGQGDWAYIGNSQKDEIIEYMRYCYKNRIRNNKGGLDTAEKFTWANTAKKIIGIIENEQ